MYDKVIFFNHYGNGDLFESTAFIEELHDTIPAHEYIYSHGKSNRIFNHLPWLVQDKQYVDRLDHRLATKEEDNCFYLNTWIGRDGRYVLPGIGCTVEMLHAMYNDMLRPYGISLKYGPYNYIPTIPHITKAYNYEPVLDFVEKNQSKFKLVLISNGNVQSCQADNFSFVPIIKRLSTMYEDHLFILTNPMWETFRNVRIASDITKVQECDLHEIGLLANYCQVIIGRCSGPIVFAQHRWKWQYSNHKSISFTYSYEGSHFVLSDQLPMKKIWSPATSIEDVYNKIAEGLNE
jgi:hypothetical protein